MSVAGAARLALLASLATGCGILGIDGYDGKVTWEVAPQKAACSGLFETTCLQVREPGSATYENFYGSIDGFDYQPGFQYLIRVGWHKVDPVPVDGSSRRYELLALLSKEAVVVPDGPTA